jgi:hypothetical protein
MRERVWHRFRIRDWRSVVAATGVDYFREVRRCLLQTITAGAGEPNGAKLFFSSVPHRTIPRKITYEAEGFLLKIYISLARASP